MPNAVLFPFLRSSLPFVRHFNGVQSTYRITGALTWSGMGLVGKDVAFASNYPAVGVPVLAQLNYSDMNWDSLLIDYQSIANEFSVMDTLDMFSQCLIAGKELVFLCDSMECLDKQIIALSQEFLGQVRFRAANASVRKSTQYIGKYSPISVPIVLIGGLVNTDDVTEVLLSLKNRFTSENYHVSCITSSNIGLLFGMHSFSHIFNNRALSEEEKILELNQLVTNIIQMERPELILIEAPDAIFKFNPVVPNGFGIRSHMVIQAVEPDHFVCCVPSELIESEFINGLSQGLYNKYGFPISAVHATNDIVDMMTTLEDEAVTSVHISMDAVSKMLDKIPSDFPVPVSNVITHGVGNIFQHLCDVLI